jgi:hypothetical protein
MSRRDFLMFYGVADSYGRINESRRSEVTTAAATQSGTSLVWCSDCETGTVTGGTAVINGIYHSFTFVEKGAWIPNSATLSLNQAQGGPDPFREVFGLIAINGTNKFAFSYNVNDGTGKYVVGLDGVAIGYDYDPKTLAKTNPVILTQSLDLSRFNNTSGKRYPNYLVEAFKWGDLNAAFGQYTQKVWDAFKAGGGSVWELGPSHTVIGSTTYDITTYRFMTTVPISGANFTFFVDVMDYTPR